MSAPDASPSAPDHNDATGVKRARPAAAAVVERRVAPARTLLNDRTGRVTLHPRFLTRAEADDLLAFLKTHPFRSDTVTVFGKRFECPRLVAAFGEPGRVYEFSGTRNVVGPSGWASPLIEAIVDRIAALTGQRPNFAHANLYRNGRDYIGWHADDEGAHAPGAPIVSLSVGAERKFYLKRKTAGAKTEHRMVLEHGSVLVMAGALQQHWKHSVPKQLRVYAPRYNLTFRVMV